MVLINVEGDVGSGKTLFAVILLCRNLELKKPKTIYVNFEGLTLPHKLMSPEMLNTITNAVIVLDEAWAWLEARGSGSNKLNKYASYALFQARKDNVDFILTDQLIETIDSRFRMMANWQVDCEAIEYGFKYMIRKQSRYREFRPMMLYLPYSKAEKYYPLYQTLKKVDVVDRNIEIDISTDKTKISKDISAHVDILLESYDLKKVSKGVIQSYVLDNSLPSRYVDLMFGKVCALKAKKS